jgi:DNA-binding IclR family transcriptional regulator
MNVPTTLSSTLVAASVECTNGDSHAQQLAELLPPAAGRGVLDGAFAVLDVLAHADEGLGLTALARATGLAKTSAHRLAQQLVTLGAAERFGHRYFVGPRMFRIGETWQPDRRLRRAALAPVHSLALRCRATASLRILHQRRLRTVCAAAPNGHALMPELADPETIARTATGRVLYASRPASDLTRPDCWSRREWRSIYDSLRDPRATVIDHQDAIPGVCCVSAPVRWPGGACAGALTITVEADDLPAGLSPLVSFTARGIDTALAQLACQ